MIKDRLRFAALLGVVLLCTAMVWQPEAAAERKRAAVPVFADHSGQRLSEYVTDIVTTGLFQAEIYDLVERVRLKEILREQRLGRDALADPLTAAAVGRIAGVEYMVLGTVDAAEMEQLYVVLGNQYVAKVKLSVRVVDTADGKIILAEEAEGTDRVLQVKPFTKEKAKMKKAAENAAHELVEKLARRASFTPDDGDESGVI